MLLFLPLLAVAQTPTVDIVVYSEGSSGDVSAKSLISRYMAEKKLECLNFRFVNSREKVSSPYYMEIWEREAFTNDFIFTETRTKKIDNGKGGTKEQKYKVGGVKIRTLNGYVGRFLQTKYNIVLDVFEVEGNVNLNIDDEYILKEMRGKDFAQRRELEEAMLIKHEAEVAEKRAESKTILVNRWAELFSHIGNRFFYDPIKLTTVTEKSKNKIKKMKFEKCSDVEFGGDAGLMSTTVFSENELNGVTYFVDEGSCYLNPDKVQQVNIRGGKKEIFKANEAGKPLVVGKRAYFDQDLELEFGDEVEYLHFFLMPPKNTISLFSTYEKMHTLLHMQAQYMNLRKLKVIAYWDIEKDSYAKGELILPENLFVTLPNPINPLKKNADIKYSDVIVSGKFDGKDVSKTYQISVGKNKTGNLMYLKSLNLEGFDEYLVKSDIRLVGTIKEEKNKTKEILIRSMNVPLDDLKFNVHTKPNATKKDKRKGEIDVEDITSKYSAIAKVSKGDKDLYKLIKANKTLYFSPKKKGMFDVFGSDNWVRFVRYFR